MITSKADVLILCGGLGTRLKPAIGDRQKTMALVGERPFLEWVIQEALDQGFRRLILCVGYQQEAVQDYFSEKYSGVEIIFSRETSPLGTAGAVKAAAGFLKTDPFVVMNGDSLCRVDLASLIDFQKNRAAEAVAAVVPCGDRRDGGYLAIGKDGRIEAFGEKEYDASRYLNAGVYAFSRKFLERIPADRAVSLEKEIFPVMIQGAFYAYPTQGPVFDIGTPERLEAFKEKF